MLLDLAAGAMFALSVLTYQFAAIAVLLMAVVSVWRGRLLRPRAARDCGVGRVLSGPDGSGCRRREY